MFFLNVLQVIQSQIRDLSYDLERAKKSREDLMAGYEQKMRKLMEKRTCDQSEIGALRKSMMSMTPNAELKTLRVEVRTLREELKQKTEVITNLEKLIRRQNGCVPVPRVARAEGNRILLYLGRRSSPEVETTRRKLGPTTRSGF